MRLLATTSAAFLLFASAAFAAGEPAQDGPQNAAVKSPSENNASAPVQGANSFTEGEAQTRITDKGYTKVSALKKDSAGVWRGTAHKNGKLVHVSVDYQGNVNN